MPMPVKLNWLLCAAVCLTCTVGAQGQVPPTSRVPRDPEEWKREQARQQALPNLAERFPDGWAVLHDRWNLVTQRHALDMEGADAVISELYLDYQNPDLNEANQYYLVKFIRAASEKWPEERLPRAVRQRLGEGLLEFVKAGGGRSSAGGQGELAIALARLRPGEPEIEAVVDLLLSDAVEWVTVNDSHPVVQDGVYKRAAQHWGDAYWFRVYEKYAAGALPEKRPLRYEKALEALVGVLSPESPDEPSFLGSLRNATSAVLSGCGEAAFDDDLTSRLLILYRVLLRRKPPIAQKAAEYIDGQLQRLARGSERLRSEEHWDRWGQAVAAMGLRRMSDGLQKYARRLQQGAAAGKLDGPRSKAAGHLKFLRE